MNPTRRWFVKAFSGAILTTLLGVKAWKPKASEDRVPLALQELALPQDVTITFTWLDDDGNEVTSTRVFPRPRGLEWQPLPTAPGLYASPEP